MAPTPGEGSSSDPPPNKQANITVTVRVRPLAQKELDRQSWATVEVLDDSHVLVSASRAPGPLTPWMEGGDYCSLASLEFAGQRPRRQNGRPRLPAAR